jgi:hypothetical protein
MTGIRDHSLCKYDLMTVKSSLQDVVIGLKLTPYSSGMLNMASAIGYVRVSTAGQGRSGLGLAAQRAAIVRFAQAEGLEVSQVFEEMRDGIGKRRPGAPAAARRRAQDRSQGQITRPGCKARSAIEGRAFHLGIDGSPS